MLVILTKNQILSPESVCQNCLLADQEGHPRWQQGHLCCGRQVRDSPQSGRHDVNTTDQSPQYRCQMGFRLTQVS